MNGNENLQEYMKARGQEEGWDASKAVDELVDLGPKNEFYSLTDFSKSP